MVRKPRIGLMALALTGALLVPVSAAGAAPKAPSLQSPADASTSESAPTFRWKAAKRADHYEFQLAVDEKFGSLVQGGRRGGTLTTRNTAATLLASIPDGKYFWRVRAVDITAKAGRWSTVRTFTKRWTAVADLVAPSDLFEVKWPSTPLVLQWTAVPRATKYLVSIATDEALSNVVVGKATDLPDTQGTVFSVPSTLPAGRYFWAITPVDASGFQGSRSRVGSFYWTWPSTTTPRVENIASSPEYRYVPRFSWDPVPGAARYEVEVSPAELDFAAGSTVCCSDTITGTSVTPRKVLANNTYGWRVRAIDAEGSAGVWNNGPQFTQRYDVLDPPIPNLRLTDNEGNTLTTQNGVAPTTATPIVDWDPAPGASSYEVQGLPYVDGFCNESDIAWDVYTAATAWTPLTRSASVEHVGPNDWPNPSTDGGSSPKPAGTYCVRVLARTDRDAKNNDVIGVWGYPSGAGNPTFTYATVLQTGCTGTQPSRLTADDYLAVAVGAVEHGMPLFRWKAIPNAAGYYVVVARDPEFTGVVDVALTEAPSYAPRDGGKAITYADETTSYYWMVLPTRCLSGSGVSSTSPALNAARPFDKRSLPPAPTEPAADADVLTQPRFSWTASEGARYYRLQVATDASFSNLVDDVETASTSYSSAKTYPADSTLYWRVRANDENKIGLTWSEVRTFRRLLATPAIPGDNPAGGELIPVLRWSPVEGAVSYSMHVEQADGSKKDFTIAAPALAPTVFYGLGVWRWQVRANFPSGSRSSISGPYGPFVTFARRINAPNHARVAEKTKDEIVLAWDADRAAAKYRVQTSETNSFARTIENVTTTEPAFAPLLDPSQYRKGGTVYWRVAVVDSGNNAGAYSTSTLELPRGLRVQLTGLLRKGSRSVLQARVVNAANKPVKSVVVKLSGAKVHGRKKTGRSGVIKFTIRPRSRGTITATATRKGYRTATAKLAVR